MTEGDLGTGTDAEAPPKARGFAPRVALFFIATLGGAALMRWLDLGWIGPVLFVLFMAACTLVFMRSVQRIAKGSGCASPAMLRYNRRMTWASIAYMVALMAAIFVYRQPDLPRPVMALVALAPAAAVLAIVWAMARLLLEEDDEYLRFNLARQALFATGGLLAVSTVWGFLEMFGLVIHAPAWAAVPVFAVMLGLGQCLRWMRS